MVRNGLNRTLLTPRARPPHSPPPASRPGPSHVAPPGAGLALAGLGLLSTMIAEPLYAQSFTSMGVAITAETLIKRYDPLVRNVDLLIIRAGDTSGGCGKEKDMTARGSFYCKPERKVVITQNVLDGVESKFGLSSVATLVAHEFAHARQHALTGFSQDIVWSAVFDEIQADCIAGVYMREATPIPLSAVQIEKSKRFLRAIGDYSVYERDWHGTPEMRNLAFTRGYDGRSLKTCLASRDGNWREMLDNAPQHIDRLIDRGIDFLNRY